MPVWLQPDLLSLSQTSVEGQFNVAYATLLQCRTCNTKKDGSIRDIQLWHVSRDYNWTNQWNTS